MAKVLLSIRNMVIGNKDVPLFTDVNFDICEGDCIMLCGANGSGKSTLLKGLAAKSENICMLPSRIPKVKGFTLEEFISVSSEFSSSQNSSNKDNISEAMKKINILSLADRDISTLSDGEFQKGCIATALARRSSIILLDEPTVFLDAENRLSVLQALRAICETPMKDGKRPAIMFSTHDLHEGLSVATKVIALGSDGIFRESKENMTETVSTIFETFYNFGVHS